MAKSILLIVIDCLRADHVSCYGYDRPTTPTLDDLADRGIQWTQAHSVSSWTKPAVTSLLTGLYPREHGAHLGIKRSKGRTWATTDILAINEPTLAESLTAAGWRCGAFLNNAQLDEYTRLNRGFERYTSEAGKADRLLGAFEDWLNERPQCPWFAYLHFLEAHWPYKPRRRHISLFGGDRDKNRFRDFTARDFGRLRHSLHRHEAALDSADREELIQMYDGAVRRLDGKLRTLFKTLRALDLLDETAIFVTSDHGEEFLDHGSIGHGHTLYEELTHVPLIAVVPGESGDMKCHEPVSMVDLPATLLQVAGVSSSSSGRSLLHLATDRSPVISELSIRSRYLQTLQKGRLKLLRKFKSRESDPSHHRRFDFRTDTAMEKTIQLFNLDTDPHEQVNLAEYPAMQPHITELESALDQWGDDHRPHSSMDAESTVDETVVARLRDLGYLE